MLTRRVVISTTRTSPGYRRLGGETIPFIFVSEHIGRALYSSSERFSLSDPISWKAKIAYDLRDVFGISGAHPQASHFSLTPTAPCSRASLVCDFWWYIPKVTQLQYIFIILARKAYKCKTALTKTNVKRSKPRKSYAILFKIMSSSIRRIS